MILGPSYPVTWRHAGAPVTDAEGRTTFPYVDEQRQLVAGSAQATDIELAGQSGARVDAILLIPLGEAIGPNDQFTISDSGGSLDGNYLIDVVRFTTMHQRVLLTRHEPAAHPG